MKSMAIISRLKVSPALIAICICFSLTQSLGYAAQSDVDCLQSIKNTLDDPYNYLNFSWNFSNTSEEGFICGFIGILCWHAGENKVLSIQLSGMGLRGRFPLGLAGCSSLTGLDLSKNHLFGEIPNNISNLAPFLTFLDLSSNKLTGEIPADLANCSYLNSLKLDNNRLTGRIPAQIGQLRRIKTFTVTNNRLTGPVPNFLNTNITAGSYAHNAGLCGNPLPPCRLPS